LYNGLTVCAIKYFADQDSGQDIGPQFVDQRVSQGGGAVTFPGLLEGDNLESAGETFVIIPVFVFGIAGLSLSVASFESMPSSAIHTLPRKRI
jgi:hypothetical protein